MGKRELLLIVGFLIAGVLVYQITAPPAGPNERSFSVSRFVDMARRELRGYRANAETTSTVSHALTREVTELRLTGSFMEVQITGEDRADVETTFRVQSNGYDEAEAKRLAGETQLLVDRANSSIAFESRYPDAGRQRAALTLKVPSRLRLRIEPGASRIAIANVAGVELPGARFETAVKNVAGRVAVTHRSGRLIIEDVGSLKLSGRNSDATVSRVRGEVAITIEGGELTAAALSGPVELEANNCDVRLEQAEQTRGPIRLNVKGGNIVVKGLKAETRIDGRHTDIEVVMAAPAPIAIHNEGGNRVELTPPPGAYTLDARAPHGRISLPPELESSVTVDTTADPNEPRAAGPVKGGGPTITIRSNNGEIVLLAREPPKS